MNVCLLGLDYIYNIKESFLELYDGSVGVLLGIEGCLPTALSSYQFVCLLISCLLSGVLSLQREGDKCHDPAIGSLAVVWLLTEGETAYSGRRDTA